MSKILVIGEAMWDLCHHGTNIRPSPENGSEILTADNTPPLKFLGGAANVAHALTFLGNEVTPIFLPEEYWEKKVRFINKDGDKLETCFRYDMPSTAEPAYYKNWSLRAIEAINARNYDSIVISDYGKYPSTYWDSIYQKLKQHKYAALFIHAKRPNIPKLPGWSFLNKHEYVHQTAYINNLPLITLGAQGVRYGIKTYPAPTVKQAKDVCGAGDVFLAAFASSITHACQTFEKSAGKSMTKDAIEHALRLASHSVSYDYTGLQNAEPPADQES